MMASVKKAIPGSFGASLGVSLVNFFRYPGMWGVGDFLRSFVFAFVVTTAIVAVCIWLWSRIRRNRLPK